MTKVLTLSEINALNYAAKSLGTTPHALATVIAYETIGTYSPAKSGGQTKRGKNKGKFLGLIQFSPTNQRIYGVHKAQSFEDQLDSVVEYLKDAGFKPGMDLTQLYSAIQTFDPNADPLVEGDINGTIGEHVAQMLEPAWQRRVYSALGESYQAPMAGLSARIARSPASSEIVSIIGGEGKREGMPAWNTGREDSTAHLWNDWGAHAEPGQTTSATLSPSSQINSLYGAGAGRNSDPDTSLRAPAPAPTPVPIPRPRPERPATNKRTQIERPDWNIKGDARYASGSVVANAAASSGAAPSGVPSSPETMPFRDWVMQTRHLSPEERDRMITRMIEETRARLAREGKLPKRPDWGHG